MMNKMLRLSEVDEYIDRVLCGEKRFTFRNEKERNLWIKLNAEVHRYSRNLNGLVKITDLGSIEEEGSCMWVSNNQLEYDESVHDEPRLSLSELSGMHHDELHELSLKRVIDRVINDVFDNNDWRRWTINDQNLI